MSDVAKLNVLDAIDHAASVIRSLEARVAELEEALRVAATAELYDPATGIIDADVLEIVQHTARAALRASEATAGREMTGQESPLVVSKPAQTVSSGHSKEGV